MSGFDGFAKAVGMLIEDDLERLEALGFTKDDFADNGCFGTDKLPDLLAFCEQHPEYHIVTQCDNCYSNDVRWVNRLGYYLADGSQDPGLYHDACEFCEHYDCHGECITTDSCYCEEFAGAVGLIEDDERLEALGLMGFEENGSCGTDKLLELVAFCEQHPEYHIVTRCDDGYVNQVRYVGRLCYYLADGSQDPELCD